MLSVGMRETGARAELHIVVETVSVVSPQGSWVQRLEVSSSVDDHLTGIGDRMPGVQYPKHQHHHRALKRSHLSSVVEIRNPYKAVGVKHRLPLPRCLRHENSRGNGVSKGRDAHVSSCNSEFPTSVWVSNVGQAVGGRPTTLRRDQRFEVTGARIAKIPNSATIFSESTDERGILRRRVRIEFGDHRLVLRPSNSF